MVFLDASLKHKLAEHKGLFAEQNGVSTLEVNTMTNNQEDQ